MTITPKPNTVSAISFDALDRASLDAQLSPSRSAKAPLEVLNAHVTQTSGLLANPNLSCQLDIAYGSDPRQSMDVYRPCLAADVEKNNPQTHPTPLPCLIFIHGGFWQEGGKAGSGFTAEKLVDRGWAQISMEYRLAPQVGLAEIIQDIASGLMKVVELSDRLGIDRNRLVIAGHSAGAQLAAAILCGLGEVNPAIIDAIHGLILVSGVYDLNPVAASYVNDLVAMDGTDIANLSPLFYQPLKNIPVHILIGEDEPSAFSQQSQALYQAWDPLLDRIVLDRLPGCDHFDILNEIIRSSLLHNSQNYPISILTR